MIKIDLEYIFIAPMNMVIDYAGPFRTARESEKSFAIGVVSSCEIERETPWFIVYDPSLDKM